jgi:hypothetical protein
VGFLVGDKVGFFVGDFVGFFEGELVGEGVTGAEVLASATVKTRSS